MATDVKALLGKVQSTPSLSSVIRVPTLPTLPGVPLVCGANEALGKLEGIRSKILEKLANKKEALADLAVAAGVARSTIDKLKEAEQTVYSLQNDVNGLLTNPTPAQISAFLNRWGTKLPSAELQSLISKIDRFTSGQATLNLCVDIPNFKINGLDGVLQKDAVAASTPNTNPEEAVALTPTVVDSSKSVSTGESGVVVSDVEARMETKVYTEYRSKVTLPIRVKLKEWEDEWKAIENEPGYISLVKKLKKNGYNAKELQDAGLLTDQELASGRKAKKSGSRYDDLVKYQATLDFYYRNLISIEAAGTTDNGKTMADFQKDLKEDKRIDELGIRQYFSAAETIISSNSDLIKEWYAYSQNKRKE